MIDPALVVIGFGGGAALALVYLASLRWSVARLMHSRGTALPMLLGLMLRSLLAGVTFLLLVRHTGAAGVVAALAAFLLVRTAILSRARRPAPRRSTRA